RTRIRMFCRNRRFYIVSSIHSFVVLTAARTAGEQEHRQHHRDHKQDAACFVSSEHSPSIHLHNGQLIMLHPQLESAGNTTGHNGCSRPGIIASSLPVISSLSTKD